MFYNLKPLLSKSIKRAGIGQWIEDSMVIESFSAIKDRILDPETAGQVRPMYIKNKVLAVALLSADVISQLRAREEEIIQEINREFASEVVENIRYIT